MHSVRLLEFLKVPIIYILRTNLTRHISIYFIIIYVTIIFFNKSTGATVTTITLEKKRNKKCYHNGVQKILILFTQNLVNQTKYSYHMNVFFLFLKIPLCKFLRKLAGNLLFSEQASYQNFYSHGTAASKIEKF